MILPLPLHRAVQALEVAVDHPLEVVEAVATGQGDGAQSLGLVALAVAQEAPHHAVGGVVDAAVVHVPVEAGVVDGVDRPEPHRHRRVLPEVGHEPGVGVARQPVAADLHPEVVQLLLAEAALEVGPGVHPGSGVALEVDVVADEAVVLAPEEVVEAHLVQRRRRREGRQVAADPVGGLVGPDDHGCRVPADEAADAPLDFFVAGEEGLLGGGDGVDVGREGGRRHSHPLLVGALEELGHDVAGPLPATGRDDGVERVDPLLGLGWVDVRELAQEVVGHCQ